MRTGLENAKANLLKLDKDVEKEQSEQRKLDQILAKLKEDLEKNIALGQELMSEIQATEEEKKANKEKLEGKRAGFSQLKKEMSRIDEEEAKAK